MTTGQEKQTGYRDGYCDGWMHCLERMANLAGLSGHADATYRGLHAHWETELLSWREDGDAQTSPPVPFSDWPTWNSEQPSYVAVNTETN